MRGSTLQYGDVITVTLDVPTSRRCLYELKIPLGDIDNDDVNELFTCSKCHLFACALHDETGYGLVIMRLGDNPDGWHAGVCVDEYFVDITGPRSLDDAASSFQRTNKSSRDTTIEFYGSDLQSFYEAIGAGNQSDDWWCNDGGFTFGGPYEGTVIGDVVRPFVSEFLNRYDWL